MKILTWKWKKYYHNAKIWKFSKTENIENIGRGKGVGKTPSLPDLPIPILNHPYNSRHWPSPFTTGQTFEVANSYEESENGRLQYLAVCTNFGWFLLSWYLALCQIFCCSSIQGVSFNYHQRNVRSRVSVSNYQVSVSAFMTKFWSRLEIWARSPSRSRRLRSRLHHCILLLRPTLDFDADSSHCS